MWTKVADQISTVTGQKFEIKQRHSIGGGCINQGYAISDNNYTYFIKLNQASGIDMFEAEALGLQQMWDTQTIRIPKPICCGIADNSAYLVLEWLELGRNANSNAWLEMGRQLAAMHRCGPPQPPQLWGEEEKQRPLTPNLGGEEKQRPLTPNLGGEEKQRPTNLGGEERGFFGWERNNTIGSTPQINTWTSDWAEFFTEHRIGYQLKLAKRRGGSFSQGESLLKAIPELLAGHQPQPSLVHGDLWSGNAAITALGEPAIFDPAAYYGDREVDIAMTELFGGFPAAFYRGYNEAWPLDAGYDRRKTLYNLYHILNHFNLFGGGYGAQANRMIDEILRYVVGL